LRAGVSTLEERRTRTEWWGAAGTHRFTYFELAVFSSNVGTVNEEFHKLRITIHADGYPEQSYARVERWDGNAWRWIWELPGGLMKTERPLGPEHPDTETLVREDRQALLFFVSRVVG
jgi:hypothetical protein